MTALPQITMEVIDDRSPYLPTVVALGDAHKKTLSFFPEGAFIRKAASGHIIVALDRKQCIGYLLYSPSNSFDRVTLVHLCVDPSYRGYGIAKKLVDHLVGITKEYRGIGLTCRRDYHLENFWPKLGFVAQFDKDAKTPKKLNTYWWLDYGHPDLFNYAALRQREDKLSVVIDDRIFFELYDDENTAESQLLLADWLQDELNLCLTDEIFNKINKISNLEERKVKHKFAQRFTRLPCDRQKLDNVYDSLKYFFAEKERLSASDLRNIARTMASDVQIFLTQDRRILALADEVYEQFKLSILSPTDLVIKLDEVRKNTEYQPVLLAGTFLRHVRINSGKEIILYDCFQAVTQGETKAEFQQKLRRFVAESDKFECLVATEGENKPIALVVHDRHKQQELEIPMLRVADRPISSTIARHLIFLATLISAREQRQFTRITDRRLSEIVATAIHKDHFVNVKDGFLRVNIAVAKTKLQLSQRLTDLANSLGQEYDFCLKFANLLIDGKKPTEIMSMWELEGYLFPAKIIDADIPSFIIPIKPFWAHNLFDVKLANQTLFGATKPDLAINREAVYYKSNKGPKELKLGVTGRILWYVSDDKDRGYTGVSAVRACSRLSDVAIGKPEELYRRFRNLGIYERQNVYNVAHGNLEQDIMAIAFSDTELFSQPIPLKKVQEIIGKKVPMQLPYYISPEIFAIIYQMGTES
ncbi:MAG: GNAT family N-acetyltransferase [Hormoscilla sp. GUM202]|nr:GNAT family N-acetyltransferase [Hormoscilla sp. GUM202]